MRGTYPQTLIPAYFFCKDIKRVACSKSIKMFCMIYDRIINISCASLTPNGVRLAHENS